MAQQICDIERLRALVKAGYNGAKASKALGLKDKSVFWNWFKNNYILQKKHKIVDKRTDKEVKC